MTTLIRFAAVGVTNTIVSLLSYTLLIAIGVPAALAAATAFALGAANGYRLNRSWTFRVVSGGARVLARYVSVQGLGAALSALGVTLAVVDLGLPRIAAEAVVLPLVTLTTFTLSRRLVFPSSTERSR